jgi:pimeloyl-ACP methyl ester carboxylesterase
LIETNYVNPILKAQNMIMDSVSNLSVRSADGTRIGCRQSGQGAGVVLVQGTMGTAQHFRQLAALLAQDFTVYVPDRRGRGMSESGGADYTTQKEVEDLDALLQATGARHVFGLSSGALIALQAALTLTTIEKLAIYEPPLFVNGAPLALIQRYENEMAQNKIAAAMITAMQAAQMGPPIFNLLPRWLLEPLTEMMLRQDDQKGSGDYPTMRALAGTLRHDFQVVREMSGASERFQGVQQEVLLIGGSKSQAYLKAALDALEQVLPNAKRIEIPKLDHAAPWNADQRGNPEPVAWELRRFFAG